MEAIPDLKELNRYLFVIPVDDGRFILYSPLNRKIGEINSMGVNTIHKYFNSRELSENENSFIHSLKDQRFLNDKPLKRPGFPENYGFMPSEVTLFLTSMCNLRCRYCYADAGKKNVMMPFEIAKSAVDLVSRNAGLAGLQKFALGFHGGGEPTLAWDLMKSTVDYAYKAAEEKGLDLEVFAATNGMFTQEQGKYIVERFSNLTISLDGPPDIQDFNRPSLNGKGSSGIISENLKFLDECNFNYGVRSTITARTVSRIEEIVAWFSENYKVRFIHIEPVWQCGRCQTTGEQPPDTHDFLKYFTRGLEMAEKLGISLIYSGLRVDSLVSKFCGAAGDGFNVLPEGNVTSCYEITECDDPKAGVFHYGSYDFSSKSFHFDEQKIKRLYGMSVENLEYCSDCFCKWHCGGDCLSKVFDSSNSFDHAGSPRCELNRSLSLFQLKRILYGSSLKQL